MKISLNGILVLLLEELTHDWIDAMTSNSEQGSRMDSFDVS